MSGELKSFKYKSWSLVDDEVININISKGLISVYIDLLDKQGVAQEMEELCLVQEGQEAVWRSRGVLNRALADTIPWPHHQRAFTQKPE